MPEPKINTETFTLNNGVKIPKVALGCWRSSPEDTYRSVLDALKAGYTHIDTAHVYQNEEQVGLAIRDSGIPREKLFVTTKLWGTFHREPSVGLDGSLKRLGLDYVDLYLFHWPVPMKKAKSADADQFFVMREDDPEKLDNDYDWDFIKTWAEMQKLNGDPRVRAIGVSNMSKTNLEILLNAPTTTIVPAVNQVEMHPLLPQHQLLKYCISKGIQVEAYSPLGSADSPLLTDEVVVGIAEKLGVSAACVLISWGLARDTVVLPKSVTKSRIEANLKTIELDDESVAAISKIWETKGRRLVGLRQWGVPVFNDEEPISLV